jgi:RND superfamily putative drug exporter
MNTFETGEHTLSRFRPWLAGLAVAAALVLAPSAFHAERHLETAARIEGGEAESVARQLTSRFRSSFVDRVVLVVEGLPAPDDERANALHDPAVSGILSRLSAPGPIFLGQGGGTFIIIGLAPASGSVESVGPALLSLAGDWNWWPWGLKGAPQAPARAGVLS